MVCRYCIQGFCPYLSMKNVLVKVITSWIRGSHWQMFSKIGVWRPSTILKRGSSTGANFAKFLRTAFFIKHLQWLILCYSYPDVSLLVIEKGINAIFRKETSCHIILSYFKLFSLFWKKLKSLVVVTVANEP